MANQNIPVSSMTHLVVFMTLFAVLRVSAVNILQDNYQASITPRKINIDEHRADYARRKRAADGSTQPNALDFTDVYLSGTEKHTAAYMHWSGKKSNVIYILTLQKDLMMQVVSSKLWYSKDYGSTYSPAKLVKPGQEEPLVSFFYVSPANNTRLIFADVKNKKLYITYNELKNVEGAINLTFVPDRIIPNPRIADYVLGYSFDQKQLYISENFGQTWALLHESVTSRFFWGDEKFDGTNDIVHIEILSSNGKAQYKKCNASKPQECLAEKYSASAGTFDPNSLLVNGEYIFLQKSGIFESIMFVSQNRSVFQRAFFPPQASTQNFLIVNSDESQVFIAVNHLMSCNLYLSDITGRFYVLSLNNTAFAQQHHRWFDVYIHEVRGVPGIYITNQRIGSVTKTYISFDKGGNWQALPPPDSKKCNRSDCSLHLQINSQRGSGILSETNAPGLLMAHGNIGSQLQDASSVFVSRNGGWKWMETPLPRGTYRFNILDQGSVMTAIASEKSATSIVHYSLDEGKTWKNISFLTNKNISVDGVLNEPGITTLIASVYGHETHRGMWIVVKLNFSSLIPVKCNTSDYEQWTPADQIDGKQCILGKKMTFERRKQYSVCFNGQDYERPNNISLCKCTDEDFECDYGYIPTEGHACQKADWFDDNSVLNECPEGEMFNKSKGYRKIAADACTGDFPDVKYKPVEKNCPTMKPEGLTIHMNQAIAATNSEVVFTLTQEKGSKKSTVYKWSFNGSNVTRQGFKNSTVSHIFPKYGIYPVSVEASNAKGRTKKTIQVRVEDKITETIVQIPWATRVNHFTDFDIDVYGPLVTHNKAHIHFLWIFGDEKGNSPVLSWDKRVQHSYSSKGNYTVAVEAINSVSTLYKKQTIQVFEEGIIIRLGFSKNAEISKHQSPIYQKLMFLDQLRRTLTMSFGLSKSRLAVHLHSQNPVLADVFLLPTAANPDISNDEIVEKLKRAVSEQTIRVVMNGLMDQKHVIHITSAQIVIDNVDDTSNGKSPNLKAVYIAIPVLLCAAVVTVLVLIYYKRKFRESRRYSLLRQHSEELGGLDEDDEDDPPLDLNPEFGSNRTDDDHLDLGTGSHLVMVTGRGEGGDNSVNC